MKFPLFKSVRPESGLGSMRVLIGRGEWRVVSTDSDTEIAVFVDDASLPEPFESFVVVDTSKVYCIIGKEGNKVIDVHVESV